MHCEKGELLTDITTMIDKSMLRQGHLDENGTCLMVTNDCYDQYRAMLASQKEQQIAEQKAREQLEASGVTPEYQQMLEECESYIQKIHQCNLDLPGEVITAKLSRLETVVTRILEEAKKRPKEAAALRKFMDYYMPTTWKLLDAYRPLRTNQFKATISSEQRRKSRTHWIPSMPHSKSCLMICSRQRHGIFLLISLFCRRCWRRRD